MPQFRKKPVVIEAVHYSAHVARFGWPHDTLDVSPWLDAAYEDGVLQNVCNRGAAGEREDIRIEIKTLEGTMRAEPGDWIIRGVKGELYPCKPDIFAATYEPALPGMHIDDLVTELEREGLRAEIAAARRELREPVETVKAENVA